MGENYFIFHFVLRKSSRSVLVTPVVSVREQIWVHANLSAESQRLLECLGGLKRRGRFPVFNWKGLNLNRDMKLHAVWSFSVRTLCLDSVYVTKNPVPQSVLFSKLSISSTPKVRSPSDGPWGDTTERNRAGTRRGTHSSAQGRAFEGLDSCVSSQKTYFLENSLFALKMLAKYILGVAPFLTSSVMQFLCNGTGCIVQFLPQQTQSLSLVYSGHVSKSQCMPSLPRPK